MNTIGFKNFKAFGDTMQTFSNKPITLIYGPNSVGKSSILHALMYAKAVISGENPDMMKLDDSIDLGGFKNFIHKHDDSRKFEFVRNINSLYGIAIIMLGNNTGFPSIKMFPYTAIEYKKTDKYIEETNKEKEEERQLDLDVSLVFNIKDIMSLYDSEKEFNKKIKEIENKYNNTIEVTTKFSQVKKWYNEILKFTFGISSVKYKLIVNNYKKTGKLTYLDELFGVDDNDVRKSIELYFNDELYATANFSKSDNLKYKISINQKSSVFKKIASFVNYNGNIDKDAGIQQLNKFPFNLEEYYYFGYLGIKELIEEFKENKNPWALFGEIANIWFQIYMASNNYSNLQHIEPLRHYPERNELVFEPSYSNLSALKLDSKDIWKIITLDEMNELLNKINEWLSDENKLNTPYKIEVNKFYKEDSNNKGKILENDYITKLEFLDIRKNTLVSPRDMGLGVSQILPILASCYFKNYSVTNDNVLPSANSVYIEQPELHLHQNNNAN